MLALEHPVVQAPMAGGPSTAALAAAVSEAGGLGFVAAGYRPAEAVRADIEAVRGATGRPFGVNLFADPGPPPEASAVMRYSDALRAAGHETGEPRHDDDELASKVALAVELRVAVVSFTFGCPPREAVEELRGAGAEVWVTVTTPAEAAAAAGADALVVQGVEAGGHRGGFDDAAPGDVGLLALLQLVADRVPGVPLVAAGGIATGRAVAAVLAAGAAAAQVGTAFMLADEAGTSPPQREAMAGDAPTGLTRAFSGRTARGIVNRFQREWSATAPSAYPAVHHLTSPTRAAARARGDAGGFNLWAGQAYPLARAEAAGDIVRRLSAEARAALGEAAQRV